MTNWTQSPFGIHHRYGRFAISLVHLNCGWRYWARERITGNETKHGLSEHGYPTLEAAKTAVEVVSR